MPKSNAEKMREYRARKKMSVTGVNPTNVPQGVIDETGQDEFELPLTVMPDIGSDREHGLPRTNYYSDHSAPGGWAETIRNIDPKTALRILDRIAPPRKLR